MLLTPFRSVRGFAMLAAGLALLLAGCESTLGANQLITLEVFSAGPGSGRVVAAALSNVDIDCTITNGARSGTCRASFEDSGAGGTFELDAIPADGSTLVAWTGACQGDDPTCTLSFECCDLVYLAVSVQFESDRDGDGIHDAIDNCPEIANGGQQDADGDGVGDACEIPDPCSVVPAAISVSPGDTSVVAGSTFRLSAVVTDAGGCLVPNHRIVWTSLDTDVAVVDPDSGIVTAVGPGGPARIRATSADDPGIFAEARVEVTAPPVPGGPPAAPGALAGVWRFEVQVTATSGVCSGDESRPPSVTAITLAVSGTANPYAVTARGFLDADANQLTGALDGNTVTLSGSYPEGTGITTAAYTLTWTTATSMQGTEMWSWIGPGGSCPTGTSAVTATKQ